MFAKFAIGNQSYGSWEELSYFPVFVFYINIITQFNDVTSLFIIPTISVLGIFGNVMSIVILYRHGLDKCSNILICALAVADSMYLIGINNFALFLYKAADQHYGFLFTEGVSTFIYSLYVCFVLLETVGKVVSMILPTLIITERFTAVFFPLHFVRIVTTSRIKAAVALMYPVGLAASIIFIAPMRYAYVFDEGLNLTVGYILKSDSYITSYQIYSKATQIYTTLCGPVCVGFVIFGCILISAKIQIQLQIRKRMTATSSSKVVLSPQSPNNEMKHAFVRKRINSNTNSNKTTKILLSVCIVYAVTGSFNFLSDMVFNMENLGFVTGFMIHRCGIMFLCVNSAANFIIYVVLNKNFRKTYLEIFLKCIPTVLKRQFILLNRN